MRLEPTYYEESFSWDVTGSFLTDGLNQGGIKERVSLAVSLYTQCLKSVLYELDGPNGRLNRILVRRLVNQHFTSLPKAKYIELWGGKRITFDGVHLPMTFTLNSEDLNSFTGTVSAHSLNVVNGVYFYIQDEDRERVENNVHEGDGFSPVLRVAYKTGIAQDLMSLPDDLKTAIYSMARFKYDYRDTFAPSNTKRIDWVNRYSANIR